jgi:hypothetical protein
MSRTYSHRPAWAHLVDPRVRKERHDHTAGPCTLPPFDVWFAATAADELHRYRPGCRYEVDYWAIPRVCSCKGCSGQDERKADRRRDRRQTRQALARLVQTASD